MKLLYFLLVACSLSCILPSSCRAQCLAPETIQGAEKYNDLVCSGVKAISSGKQTEALRDFITASQTTTLEFPNTLLFGRIAKIYASLGRFAEAQEYLDYDGISLLWSMGLIRCKTNPNPSIEDESLYQDGKLLDSAAAKHMAGVLCGSIYDNNDYFADRDIGSFVPVAKAILRHSELQREIRIMRQQQSKGNAH